jgi:methylenetetrahydrofolate dehydrogenase (NADP+)/methenyltetrahydrofolate cyclohydrolase
VIGESFSEVPEVFGQAQHDLRDHIKHWGFVESRSEYLDILDQADIVVSALGIPNFVTADMIKPGAVVIDVGITRVSDANTAKGYRIVGDVDFDQVAPKASFITPVPGGVGPMTIAMLLKNTLLARERSEV